MRHRARSTADKIRRRIALVEQHVYREALPLPPFRYRELAGPEETPPLGPDVDDRAWPEIEPNTYWGRWRRNFVLRSSFQVPPGWARGAEVALYLPIGDAGDFSHPEALVYVDGALHASCDRNHREIPVPNEWRDGRRHTVDLVGWTGLGGWPEGNPGTQLFMRPCALVSIDQPLRALLVTARVARGVAEALSEDHPARDRLLSALDEAFRVLDTREPLGEHLLRSVGAAHSVLRDDIDKAGPPLDVEVIATGHAHIDVAWLWTLGETRAKSARSFTNVLSLMERHNDLHFVQSQPQLYEYIAEDHPHIYEEIRKRVAEGRWEPLGGMWVEADCNITGHESLARQFLLGRSFFRDAFGPGSDSPVLWLPDVFGYSWALPQLIKEAGLEYFMTIKIGWNQVNRMPYDSFWWQGLDGTRVLTHFSTTPAGGSFVSTYNATATPEEALGTWANFQQKDLRQQLLMIYGYGDGGGGPTREMLENVDEMRSFPAAPQLHHGRVDDFFRRMETDVGDSLPTWNGELYLEMHRGTYTTQSRSKQANRCSEFLLHDAELVAAWAKLIDLGYSYPHDELERAWKLVCLNQFHDIIPGSSIGAVYEASMRHYAEVAAIGERVRETALDALAEHLGGDLLVVNPTSFERDDVALWPTRLPQSRGLRRADGTPVTTQVTEDGTLIETGELQPFSATPLWLTDEEAEPSGAPPTSSRTLLENDWLRVELSRAGDVVGVLDKASGREVLPPGGVANQLQAFEDRPLDWDAWDLDAFFDDKMWTSEPADSVEVVARGPVRAVLEIRRRILNSEYVQRVWLDARGRRLNFDTSIEWRERHVLLKVAFPVDVLSPMATHEIQWGNVERPTHRNTSWDWARFETCAQKWIDLSEGDYGVSLLNDCKHGHDVRDNVMRMSLLRSPTMPDPEADQGAHRFSYSLLPHRGRWGRETIAAAYALNDPLIVVGGSGSGSGSAAGVSSSLVRADREGVVIETVKWSEDGRGLIVRLYESMRQRGDVTLSTAFQMTEAWRANLLEEDVSELTCSGGEVELEIRPFEIVTLRLVPAPT